MWTIEQKELSVLHHLDFSARGSLRVVLWTFVGTAVCIGVAFGLDSSNFSTLDDNQRWHAMLTDIVTPMALGLPVFFFFSSKLRDLAIAHYKLAEYASTDGLTGLLNRTAFTTAVDRYLANPAEIGGDGALLIIDVDNFKLINDALGHYWGDEALQLIATTIRLALRHTDVVGRLGGEEFGVFLPATSPQQAEAAAEQVRAAVAAVEFAPNGVRQALSISVGGTSFRRVAPFPELYREADRRLYEAKRLGRNQVVFSMRPADAWAA